MPNKIITPARLFILAVVLRSFIAIGSENTLISDELDYATIASHITSGQGFSLIPHQPTAYRAPAYPYFLAGLFSISSTLTFIKIIQALIESVSCLLLFFIGKKIFSEHAGLAAMLLWTLFPTSILMPSKILTETLFTFLLLSIIALQVSHLSSKKYIQWCCGVIAGIILLIKPQAGVLLIAVLLYKIFRKEYAGFHSVGYMLVGTMLVIIPWCVRNAVVFDTITISTNGGINFWIGNNEESNGSYKIPQHDTLAQISNEIERNSTGYSLGRSFIVRHPVRFLSLAIVKTAYLYSSQNYIVLPDHPSLKSSSYADIMKLLPWWKVLIVNVPYLFILFFGGAGLVLFRQTYTSNGIPLHMIIACWAVVHMIYFGASRFNYPMLPLFALLSGAVIASGSLFSRSAGKQQYVAAAISILVLLPTTAEMILIYLV